MSSRNLTFNIPVHITKQGSRFVAYTPALDISTSGKSEKDVKKKFGEIANLFLEEIIEAGTSEQVLSELGWKKVQKKWAPPKVVSTTSIGFHMPTLV